MKILTHLDPLTRFVTTMVALVVIICVINLFVEPSKPITIRALTLDMLVVEIEVEPDITIEERVSMMEYAAGTRMEDWFYLKTAEAFDIRHKSDIRVTVVRPDGMAATYRMYVK